MNITKASLVLEIDGQMCLALLDGIDKNLLVETISCLFDDGKLKVVKMPDDYQWDTLTQSA